MKDDKSNEKPLETKLPVHSSEEPKMKALEEREEEREMLAQKHGVDKNTLCKRMGIWYIGDTPLAEHLQQKKENIEKAD